MTTALASLGRISEKPFRLDFSFLLFGTLLLSWRCVLGHSEILPRVYGAFLQSMFIAIVPQLKGRTPLVCVQASGLIKSATVEGKPWKSSTCAIVMP